MSLPTALALIAWSAHRHEVIKMMRLRIIDTITGKITLYLVINYLEAEHVAATWTVFSKTGSQPICRYIVVHKTSALPC